MAPRSFLVAPKLCLRFSRPALRLRDEREGLGTKSHGSLLAPSAVSRDAGSTVSSLRTKSCESRVVCFRVERNENRKIQHSEGED